MRDGHSKGRGRVKVIFVGNIRALPDFVAPALD